MYFVIEGQKISRFCHINTMAIGGCLAGLLGLASACNVTSPYVFPNEARERTASEEVCDRIDNDLDELVDEDFRTDAGVYMHDDHCGACGRACVPDEVTLKSRCEMTEFGPACRAVSCVEGYMPSTATCLPWDGWLCLPCLDSGECGGFDGAFCAEVKGELRCLVSCVNGRCPGDYQCFENRCLPPSGSCNCNEGDDFALSCTIDVNGEACFGTARCLDGVLSECTGSVEVCDGLDNDCNGVVDDPFVDAQGRYTTDIHHCGACGVDCTLNQVADFEIVCGGPSVRPVCSILCEDTLDGLHVGDFIDADRESENGCECELLSLGDIPGADSAAAPEVLDANCDGADGVVEESIYVIPTGDDSGPGTPDAPFGTIQGAVEAAFSSLATSSPSPHVFVAAGVYSEVLRVRNGVSVHGGYRPDFLERDRVAYATEIHAPSWESSPGGAALVAGRDTGVDVTQIDNLVLRGASALAGGGAAVGAYLDNPGPGLALLDAEIRSGDGSDGAGGADGAAGLSPPGTGFGGQEQKVAVEDADTNCIEGEQNTNLGGAGQSYRCGDTEVSGGKGGDSTCAVHYTTYQASGESGIGYGDTRGGAGGAGGWDAIGPIIDRGIVYCGLADFTVDGNSEMAADGEAGDKGASGLGGDGCTDAYGRFVDQTWVAGTAEPGTDGLPGAGGGGGGAGGSVVIDGTLCPFADGIGGGGGGGGAGGCGGSGGGPGTSGGPSVGVVMEIDDVRDAPELRGLVITTGIGGDGGQGGHGGDGGQGGAGGLGGELLPMERTIPPLAGPDSGGHGGAGGNGGRGGGSGGGCGGATVGIWLVAGGGSIEDLEDRYAAENAFALGKAGTGGENGYGGSAGFPGSNGASVDVLSR